MIPDISDSTGVGEMAGIKSEKNIEDGLHDWLESHIDIVSLFSIYEEELKTDTNAADLLQTNNNDGETKVVQNGQHPDDSTSADGPPDDIRAFYGHPLTAATTDVNEEDTHASAVALLHEYINLPALDKSGMKIGDKINSIYDIMRDDGSSAKLEPGIETSEAEYIQLLQTTLASEVDKFFIRDCGEDTTATISDSNCPVSVAEEVIQDICVENACMNGNTEPGADLYTQLNSETNTEVSSNIAEVLVPVEDKSLPLDMPALEDLRNESASQSCNVATPYTGPQVSSNVTAKPVSRRSKAHPSEKSQELSKKLVKALTEKILRRKNQQAQESDDSVELANAVSSVTTQPTETYRTSTAVNNFIQDSIDLSTKLTSFSEKHEQLLETLHEDLTIEDGSRVISSLPVTTQNHSSQISSVGLEACAPSLPCSTTQNIVHSPARTQSSYTSAPGNKLPLVMQVSDMTSMTPDHIPKHPQYIRNLSVPGNINQSFASLPNHGNNNATNQNTVPSPMVPYYYPQTPQTSQASSNGYVYRPLPRTSVNGSDERDMMLERYIHQQNQFIQEQPNHPYPVPQGKENYNMKSPDSGYGDACVSPRENNSVQYKEGGEQYVPDADSGTGKVAKRRRSAPAMYVKQYWLPTDKTSKSTIAKLVTDPAGYKYYLESPISTNQRIEEDRITYLNKGQYYGLTLEYSGERPVKNQMVKSLIMVVFREDKHLEDERKAWEFWHSRQHSYKQRVIDIDTKNSVGVAPSYIEEISYNAVAVKWNPRESHVKVNVAVHCLSTDFSNQKGVKGLPLHIQIDTFESLKDANPISRGYCQIKVFCDKGAERKARDEERRKQCRVKNEPHSTGKSSRKRQEDVYHEALDRSEFYVMADLQTHPILFSPVFEGDESTRTSPITLASQEEDCSSSVASGTDQYDSTEDSSYPLPKRQRTDSYVPYTSYPNVLLYVREKHEVIFTAIMLRSPTVQGLLQAVEEKYKISASKIKNCYKRSRKGILVRMDDNIIRHYSHESTFIIELNCVREDQESELILTEIEPS